MRRSVDSRSCIEIENEDYIAYAQTGVGAIRFYAQMNTIIYEKY